MKNLKKHILLLVLCFPVSVFAQKAYFVDGFHGGIWGHYPQGYTSYIVEQLNKNPDWKINLEIEPETWDRAEKMDKTGYNELQSLLKQSPDLARVEYVNPTYAQPYMFNISGESIIRQFSYGMKKLKYHFPSIKFKTYSSEEPCFTSALPQILNSFGYKYASLKNPNTCWGGYTSAYGKELVNWVGPDGSSILTSPRYSVEDLKPGSTWETIASGNSEFYINAALKDGIKHPVGMCLQDAGWRYGPWLKGDYYKPTVYTTWTNYFQNIAQKEDVPNWNFTQEDVLTSLVWGSQVLQKLAQEVRQAENNIVQAEKIASIDKLDNGSTYPEIAIDEAWKNLLLSQHHDCWIVPYNGRKGDNWADKVKVWTSVTNAVSDSIRSNGSNKALLEETIYLKVYNTLGKERKEWVNVKLPKGFDDGLILDDKKKPVISQKLDAQERLITFKADVPAMGYAVYTLQKKLKIKEAGSAKIYFAENGDCILETDLYKIHLDKANGGVIKSLVAKSLNGKDFVDTQSDRKFNELRGNFYRKGGFRSSTESAAKITVLENGPSLVSVKIEGLIAENPFSQIITLSHGEKKIGIELKIDWKANEGIGEFEETNYQSTALHKAFYNDKYKLLTLFPLALKNQKVYKDAPFDVTESKLSNTFFSTWDSIKNNIILNWVDVLDGDEDYGMALYTDHTTSYAHGEDYPLGLTTQYAGQGLWGRNYKIDGPTEIKYTLLPHQGNWEKAGIGFVNEEIQEPLFVSLTTKKPNLIKKSYIELMPESWVISSCTFINDEMYLRIFNNSRKATSGKIKLGFDIDKATYLNLDKTVVASAIVEKTQPKMAEISTEIPPFGIKTIQISK